MRLAITFLPLAFAASCGEPAPLSPPSPLEAEQSGCDTRAYAEIGGPFELIDHTGRVRTEADFKGGTTLVYFGFTHCDLACPPSMVLMDRALRRLPEEIERPQTILISLDPERDTPALLSRYVETPAYPDALIGLTGSRDAVDAAAATFKNYYEIVPLEGSKAGYTIDHASLIYLMDEDWKLKTFFTTAFTTDEAMAACLETHLG
ncbi:MAG: SCO family protein [Pseudomonadota bacterium]